MDKGFTVGGGSYAAFTGVNIEPDYQIGDVKINLNANVDANVDANEVKHYFQLEGVFIEKFGTELGIDIYK